MLNILVQKGRDKRAAKRFFLKLLKASRSVPRVIVMDRLGSYGAARRELLPRVRHVQDRWQNNRAEVSYEATRQRERQMRRFKSVSHAQRFLSSQRCDRQPVPLLSAPRCGFHQQSDNTGERSSCSLSVVRNSIAIGAPAQRLSHTL